MQPLTSILVLAHAVAAAVWVGAMLHSLVVVQPRLRQLAGDVVRLEDLQQRFAHGNRWPGVGMIAFVGLTGAGLVLATAPDAGGGWWWAAVAAKAGLLAGAAGLFWWVSWRAWPRRVFALPSELPGLQRRFRLVATAMVGLVGAAFVLGVLTR